MDKLNRPRLLLQGRERHLAAVLRCDVARTPNLAGNDDDFHAFGVRQILRPMCGGRRERRQLGNEGVDGDSRFEQILLLLQVLADRDGGRSAGGACRSPGCGRTGEEGALPRQERVRVLATVARPASRSRNQREGTGGCAPGPGRRASLSLAPASLSDRRAAPRGFGRRPSSRSQPARPPAPAHRSPARHGRTGPRSARRTRLQ